MYLAVETNPSDKSTPRTQKRINEAIHSKNLSKYEIKYNAHTNLDIKQTFLSSNTGTELFDRLPRCLSADGDKADRGSPQELMSCKRPNQWYGGSKQIRQEA